MPVILKKERPVLKGLQAAGTAVYGPGAASPGEALKIVVLNLMPNKEETEEQVLQLLAESPRLVAVEFAALKSYQPKHTSPEYMAKWYKDFFDLAKGGIDGLIITGAPLEHLEFSQVLYWKELTEIMDYAQVHIPSTLYLCWAAPAALWHFYHIPITLVAEKVSGIFPHVLSGKTLLTAGLPSPLFFPHSRYFSVTPGSLARTDLQVLAWSQAAGIGVMASPEGKEVYVTGHFEYGRDTLQKEYFRDLAWGLDIRMPENYFPGDCAANPPVWSWRETAAKFYCNWLNLCRKGGKI